MQHRKQNPIWAHQFISAFILATIFAIITMVSAGAQTSKASFVLKGTLKGTYKDWRLFVDTDSAIKTCYIAGEPREMEPRNAKRGEVFLSVAHRPAQGVRNEINVRIGYPFSAISKPFAEIGADEFSFFTGVQAQNGADEAAWLAEISQQPRMVAAMKRGLWMIFKGTSARGTLTTDSYSLRGFTAAMRALDAACPKR